MCGIAGLVQVQQGKLTDVANMISCIRYRGRDEADTINLDDVILGHARLAVVDPENGKQPMSNEDGTVWVTFNGEIYNYVELREELKSKGHIFKSRCDTEVLVHLWEELGEKMLDRLIGMFTFFVWDQNSKRGILARDRQGIKPCFIADYKNGIAFASEIKAILSLPEWKKEIDHQSLMDVFTFNYPVPPATCFKGIKHLEPGSYLLFERNKPLKQKRYWHWPFEVERHIPSNDEFAALLDDAIRLQMRFDVKGGLYLSGGVDSSVVAAHLVKQWKDNPLSAIGLKFAEKEYSEYHFSEEAASYTGVQLKPAIIADSNFPEIISKVILHAEQPHGDFSFFLFYILAHQANSEGKIVMFSGDGPDEASAGFSHNEQFFQNQQSTSFSLRKYFEVICYMPEGIRSRILMNDFVDQVKDPIERFRDMIEPWQDLEPVEQIMAYECNYLMPGNNLVKSDRMGAAWSTEGRSPFLDHRVSEIFTKLPVREKIHDGFGKYFLKKYATTLFPKQFVFRNKTMPTAPIGEWLKGPLYSWARDILSSKDDYPVSVNESLKLLDEHRQGLANHTRILRTIITFKEWKRVFGL